MDIGNYLWSAGKALLLVVGCHARSEVDPAYIAAQKTVRSEVVSRISSMKKREGYFFDASDHTFLTIAHASALDLLDSGQSDHEAASQGVKRALYLLATAQSLSLERMIQFGNERYPGPTYVYGSTKRVYPLCMEGLHADKTGSWSKLSKKYQPSDLDAIVKKHIREE